MRLSEILIPTGSNAPSATGLPVPDDPAQVSAAQTKAQEVYSQLKRGAKFEDLAKAASSGPNAAQGGDLGVFERGKLPKIMEDQTFNLSAGQFTEPIRTKQGFVILDVTNHVQGGVPPLKDVLPQVEEALGTQRTEPALRAYLKQLRMEAYIDYKPGYVDSAAVVNPSKPVYSAYNAPSPKKKKKIERTRYRQRTFGSGPRNQQASSPSATSPAPPASVPSLAEVPGAATTAPAPAAPPSGSPTTVESTSGQVGAPGARVEDQVGISNPPAAGGSSSAPAPSSQGSGSTRPAKNSQVASATTQKPGKKEKIRFGQAPTKTLPSTTATQTVDAGAAGPSAMPSTTAQNGIAPETQVAANTAGDAPSVGESAPPEKKTRFSYRAKEPKEKKSKEPKIDPFSPPPVSPEEVADRQTQSAPLGLAGDTSKGKKKPKPTEKTRLQDQPKNKPADDANAPADAPDTPAAAPATVPAPSAPPTAQPQ